MSLRTMVGMAIALLVLVIFPRAGFSGRQLLTDEELDEVAAGSFNFSLNPDTGGVNFTFDMGSVLGNGQVGLDPNQPLPVLTVNGNGASAPNLSNSQFFVQNMIFNLNLCVQCKANVINQLGFGMGVNFP